MTRTALTDGSGTWFNTDSAVLFKEDTRWDGRNKISVPTGSQWDHEGLYYTKNGKWVLNHFSNYQNTWETHEQISEEEAIKWLVQNRCFDDDGIEKLPSSVRDSVKQGFVAAEI